MTAPSRDLPPSQPARNTWTCTKTLDVHQLPPTLLCRLPVCDPASRSPFSRRICWYVATKTTLFPRALHGSKPRRPARTHVHLAPASTQALPAPREPDVVIPPISYARFGSLSLTCPRTLIDLTGRLPAPPFEDLPNPATTRGNFVHNINGSPAAWRGALTDLMTLQDLFGAMSAFAQ
ncbi:hypothetical protein FB451DRAFT_1422953 [Mycena latifolia]|nr:hypothetical protein FB451DRAFT_1422953 [Mycena latifolia]